MYKNIIFDADGTLLDTLPGITEGFNYALSKLGKPLLSPEQVKPFMGPALRDTFMGALGFSQAEAIRAVELYREFYWDKGYRMCDLFDGVAELLVQLKKEGKILCVATNKPQPFIELILKEKGYYDLFSMIAGAQMNEASTDKTPLVQKATLDASSAVMVGDRYVDITAANNAGISSIGVLWGSAEEDEFITYPPTHIAKTPKDVYRIVSGTTQSQNG